MDSMVLDYHGHVLFPPNATTTTVQTPTRRTPVRQAPAPQTPAPQTPAPQTPAHQRPAPRTPAALTPSATPTATLLAAPRSSAEHMTPRQMAREKVQNAWSTPHQTPKPSPAASVSDEAIRDMVASNTVSIIMISLPPLFNYILSAHISHLFAERANELSSLRDSEFATRSATQ
ncbi:translation initiation factor IF-2-like [Frankliniella occidentalis]|uniref:Translation initiation factor IF-2-like n=1 Tax=Frankliniella occidentalis TaxID=133901 RepID=A0A9C6XS25_FRAOC|nr:translation initiation factor IF-2-like [Frankliniella occidentalis]